MMIYTVRRGDTLYRIAKRAQVDVTQLARDNGIEHPEALSVGQTLVISAPRSVYTVREGDTLYSIAQHFSVRVGDLLRNNPFLGGMDALHPGDVLTIVGEEPTFDREISVNTYVYPSVDRADLRTMLPALTYLTVMGYGIEEDGTLIEPMGDEEIVELAREYGTAPMMQVSGAGGDGVLSGALAACVLSDEMAAQTLISEIENVLSQKRYHGVEIHFQGLPTEMTSLYGAWLDHLRRRLAPSGRRVHVLLTPQDTDGAPDWFGGVQDFSDIGERADGENLATYGWGYAYGEPMAVSPIKQVREALLYATERVPSERLTLGLSQYGYEWPLPFVAGQTRARPMNWRTATTLAREKRAAIAYDDEQEAPYVRWFEKRDGRAQEHVAYFEDARSIAARLALVNEYGLDGISLWNGMEYAPQLWKILLGSYPVRKIWE